MTSVAILRNPIDVSVRDMVFSSKINVDITLAEPRLPRGTYFHSYSTLDRIEGTVSITPKHDALFDDLDISLIGVTKTFVDKLTSTAHVHGRTEATHRFLRLVQPRNELRLPTSGVLKAGKTYRFPFTFVIPSQLLPRACTHRCENNHVKDAHLHLPPSMGDPELAGNGVRLLDDLAPAMTKISYAIRARLTKDRDDDTEIVLAESSKKLRIAPAFEEAPPLSVDANDDEYKLRLEKTVRKGLMKGKLGRLVIESSQPKSFQLPAVAPGQTAPPVSTMAKVYLRFDPHEENSPPPRLSSLASKLKVTTFFASSSRSRIPTKTTTFPDMSQGFITDSLPLSTRCLAAVEWTRHKLGDTTPPSPRRDSAISRASTLSNGSTITPPSSSYHPTYPFYTAVILVPLSLPATKQFIPTFHSCIVSRIYALSISLSIQGQPMFSALTLKVPIQISADGSPDAVERRRQSEQAELAFMEAEAVFEPRTIGVGGSVSLGASEMPPGYDGLGLSGGGVGGSGLSESTIAGVAVCG